MSDTWYYLEGSERVGPITLAQLQKLLATGKLQGNDHVWHPGMPEWARIRTVPVLATTGERSEAVTRDRARSRSEPVEELEELEEVDSAGEDEGGALRVLDDDERLDRRPRRRHLLSKEEEDRPHRRDSIDEEEEEEERPRKKKKKKKKKKINYEMREAARQAATILFVITGLQILIGLVVLGGAMPGIPPDLRVLAATEYLVLGMIFGGLGAWALFAPFIPTLIGLLLYFGYWVFMIFMDPTFAYRGIIVRLLIIGGFVKALERAKAASEGENRVSHW